MRGIWSRERGNSRAPRLQVCNIPVIDKTVRERQHGAPLSALCNGQFRACTVGLTHEKWRPSLPHRRLRLHLSRLPRATSADAQIGQPTYRSSVRILQHAVEAAERCAQHRCWHCAYAFCGNLRLFIQNLPQRSLFRIQGQPLGAAGGPDPAVQPDPTGNEGVRSALHRDGWL